MEELKGGVAGGSILCGVLRVCSIDHKLFLILSTFFIVSHFFNTFVAS